MGVQPPRLLIDVEDGTDIVPPPAVSNIGMYPAASLVTEVNVAVSRNGVNNNSKATSSSSTGMTGGTGNANDALGLPSHSVLNYIGKT